MASRVCGLTWGSETSSPYPDQLAASICIPLSHLLQHTQPPCLRWSGERKGEEEREGREEKREKGVKKEGRERKRKERERGGGGEREKEGGKREERTHYFPIWDPIRYPHSVKFQPPQVTDIYILL